MKTIITSILLLALVQQVSASSYFDQLCDFNPNWKKYETRVSQKEAIQFSSEVEYIQAHLTSVLTILHSNPTDHLTTSQLDSRLHLIEVLDAYRQAGKFPINYYVTERIPVFIDEHNTHCAVGFLMEESGFESLARDIAANDNYIWVKDITDPRVIDWQVNSGFTLEELKIIQGAYDFYMPDAYIAPNRYEIPQKPACATAYFEDQSTGNELAHTAENVWFIGEGKNGILNGKWEQNYAVGIPWILGYYKNGKRTGQWKEYYQGTDILCRTENWRDDKLNGMRIRFDREGTIIEEIMFKDGNAVTKTNYDRAQGTKSIRTPLDSVNLYTEVYTLAGRLLAAGNEQVHNPGNLLWFQNIELTALNSAAITARDMPQSQEMQLIMGDNSGMNDIFGQQQRRVLFQTPTLVEYKKEGKWVYFGDSDQSLAADYRSFSFQSRIQADFKHFGQELSLITQVMGDLGLKNQLDSLVIYYVDNMVTDFFGHGEKEFKHLHFTYHDIHPETREFAIYQYRNPRIEIGSLYRLKQVGEYNASGYRVGEWKYFDANQILFKVEKYLIPQKEEELELGQK